jgi:hypothetical protein
MFKNVCQVYLYVICAEQRILEIRKTMVYVKQILSEGIRLRKKIIPQLQESRDEASIIKLIIIELASNDVIQ